MDTPPAAFHRSFPGYEPTPLVSLPTLARRLGVGQVLVKDESNRLGLPAFKVLGASWAVNRELSRHLGVDPAGSLVELQRRAAQQTELTLVTATDGNHGRAIARMAGLLGLSARVYVPAGLSQVALDAIRGEGAEVVESGGVYDDVVVQAAASVVVRPRDLLIQDTSWPGYEQIPAWIVHGYSTLFVEIDQELTTRGCGGPAAVVVPTGVGSLLQSAVEHYRAPGAARPAVVAVEPVTAGCITLSLQRGRAVSVDTSAHTVMAGLNCGTPSVIAWPSIHAGVDAAQTVADSDARRAVRDLNELGVQVGPCGAAAMAGISNLLAKPGHRHAMNLDGSSVLVLISTEGLAANPITL